MGSVNTDQGAKNDTDRRHSPNRNLCQDFVLQFQLQHLTIPNFLVLGIEVFLDFMPLPHMFVL